MVNGSVIGHIILGILFYFTIIHADWHKDIPTYTISEMDGCPHCKTILIQQKASDLSFECLVCKHKWKKEYVLPCSCGSEVNLSGTCEIRMVKDGKTGWFQCSPCGKYLNKCDKQIKITTDY